MVNGRAKGSCAEREVAKLISEWWSAIEPDCRFVKTPMSGGWSTPQIRSEFRVSGDLCTTARRFPFSVEVKRREKWNETWLKEGRPSQAWGWWAQACRQAAERLELPMLWFRRSRSPWLVMLPEETAARVPIPGIIWIAWTRAALLDRVDADHAHPIVYEANSILALDPARFALPPPRRAKR